MQHDDAVPADLVDHGRMMAEDTGRFGQLDAGSFELQNVARQPRLAWSQFASQAIDAPLSHARRLQTILGQMRAISLAHAGAERFPGKLDHGQVDGRNVVFQRERLFRKIDRLRPQRVIRVGREGRDLQSRFFGRDQLNSDQHLPPGLRQSACLLGGKRLIRRLQFVEADVAGGADGIDATLAQCGGQFHAGRFPYIPGLVPLHAVAHGHDDFFVTKCFGQARGRRFEKRLQLHKVGPCGVGRHKQDNDDRTAETLPLFSCHHSLPARLRRPRITF